MQNSMSETTKKYAPLLPFDITYGENLDMYDHFAYKKNNNVCNATNIRMESGNVYKFFRCAQQEPLLVGGK